MSCWRNGLIQILSSSKLKVGLNYYHFKLLVIIFIHSFIHSFTSRPRIKFAWNCIFAWPPRQMFDSRSHGSQLMFCFSFMLLNSWSLGVFQLSSFPQPKKLGKERLKKRKTIQTNCASPVSWDLGIFAVPGSRLTGVSPASESTDIKVHLTA